MHQDAFSDNGVLLIKPGVNRQTDRQDRTGQDRTGQDRAGQGRAGQGRTDRQTDRQTDKHTYKHTYSRTDMQTDGRTDTQRYMLDHHHSLDVGMKGRAGFVS